MAEVVGWEKLAHSLHTFKEGSTKNSDTPLGDLIFLAWASSINKVFNSDTF